MHKGGRREGLDQGGEDEEELVHKWSWMLVCIMYLYGGCQIYDELNEQHVPGS